MADQEDGDVHQLTCRRLVDRVDEVLAEARWSESVASKNFNTEATQALSVLRVQALEARRSQRGLFGCASPGPPQPPHT
ncbi:MAG TPA: hypothetical protein VMI06_00870 [Terriglobia bacterium]|nr:hypothetical protein [Terriglobia bacterium]